jgi:hypothetical protein
VALSSICATEIGAAPDRSLCPGVSDEARIPVADRYTEICCSPALFESAAAFAVSMARSISAALAACALARESTDTDAGTRFVATTGAVGGGGRYAWVLRRRGFDTDQTV